MATTPPNDEAQFDETEDGLPEDSENGSTAPSDDDLPEGQESDDIEEAQEEAAEERKEGGYQ